MKQKCIWALALVSAFFSVVGISSKKFQIVTIAGATELVESSGSHGDPCGRT